MAEKRETRELLQKQAECLFESNKELTEVHLCSNGQGFTDKQYAERYAKQFADDNVYSFVHEERANAKKKAQEEAARKQSEAEAKAKEEKAKKALEAKKQAALNLASKQEAFDYENAYKKLLSNRDFLVARYEMLVGKKPAHNIGTEKLAEQVVAAEKEKFNTQK